MPALPDTRSIRLHRRLFTIAAAAGAASLALPARAQPAWPSRPIRIVVPYTPGGFTDQMARLVQVELQNRLGQPVLIDNKPGANSIIGVDMVAKAPPDGYTFGVVIAAYSANTTLYPKLPYDPARDLRGVALIGVTPLVAAVPAQAPFKTARELVDYARANPGKVSFGSSGNGSAAHLTTELLKLQTGIRMVHIPYRGTAPALADLMGGQIQLLFDTPSSLAPQGRDGKIRLIGLAGDQRLPSLPELPTFIEQGFAGFNGSTWAGMLAPAGTPAPVVARMAQEVSAVVRGAEIRSRMDAMGTLAAGGSPAEFDAFISAETEKWAKVIRAADIKAEA
ncbi:tripartite tricarboxylate transporter substrate binding protein [Xylophilus sp. GOD-11R]|uniref:tripartite tricarboxylate transporter substrate binding protein n=1 Tax=Xylophilus sp. GOD-11R TaxID=3089814 RepID=UPI00298C33CF|nr:tripartite tricarboxylate transporter substrate binding protein [Xylophilus sp. GOD-11R]WPB59005.1 tripartite tricarboxylate transporter substrate binding protein [Xylophilus sp. GOD-11R]